MRLVRRAIREFSDGPSGGAPAGPDLPPPHDENLRSAAIHHLKRVRKLKLDLAAFVLGSVIISTVWAITEYQNSGRLAAAAER